MTASSGNKKPKLLDRLRFVQTPCTGKKAAIYVRVSSDEMVKTSNGKEERASVQAQREDAIALCKSKGWVYEIYDGDSDRSGFEDFSSRPSIAKMIQDIRDGKIHTVVTREAKRLYRSQALLTYFVNDILIPAGVNLHTLSEQTDITSGDGRMMLSIRGHVGENELFYIAEKSSRSRLLKAEAGQLRLPPSFALDIVEEKGVRRTVIDEAKAAIVREVYKRCVDGEPSRKITDDLNRRGIKSKRGCRLRPSMISKWLSSPIYNGRISYAGKIYPAPFAKVVDDELWEQAQQATQARFTGGKRSGGRKHLLSGILKCGYCSSVIATDKNADRFSNYSIGYRPLHYRCQSRAKANKTICLDSVRLRADIIEPFIVALLKSLLKSDYLEHLKGTGSKQDTTLQEIAHLESEVKRLTILKRKSTMMLADGTIDELEYANLQKDVRAKLASAEMDLANLKRKQRQSTIGEIEDAIKSFAFWNDWTVDDKRVAIGRIIDRVMVFRGHLLFYFKALESPMKVPLKVISRKWGYAPSMPNDDEPLTKDQISIQTDVSCVPVLMMLMKKACMATPVGK